MPARPLKFSFPVGPCRRFFLLPERPLGFICLRGRGSFLCLRGREILFVFVAVKVALSAGLLKFSLFGGRN